MAQGKGHWKDVVLAAVVSVAVSLFASVTATGQRISERPTRQEVTEKIKSESPYVRDQALIQSAVQKLEEMQNDIAEMKKDIAVIEERTR